MVITVGGWVVFIVFTLLFFGLAGWIGVEFTNGPKGIIISMMIALFLTAITFAGLQWYYTSTAKGLRAVKTQQSEFNNGINRQVTVYDMNGKVIKSYEGKFDVTYDDDRILFDDEKGFRHIIYYPTGTVIIDEIE